MSLVPPTTRRVAARTATHVNRRIEQQMEANLVYYASHPDEIDHRLEDLDREWDIERMLEANAASFSLLGLALATAFDRRWLVLPIGVAAFLLQHAVQGWCPPVPVFRRLGIRTAAEIAQERYALKALRGDFDGFASAGTSDAARRAQRALVAVRLVYTDRALAGAYCNRQRTATASPGRAPGTPGFRRRVRRPDGVRPGSGPGPTWPTFERRHLAGLPQARDGKDRSRAPCS